jgi:hypothetical protein
MERVDLITSVGGFATLAQNKQLCDISMGQRFFLPGDHLRQDGYSLTRIAEQRSLFVKSRIVWPLKVSDQPD